MRRRTRRLSFAAFAVGLALFTVAPAALAATDSTSTAPQKLSIRKVDSTDPKAVKVSLIYNGTRSDLAGLTLRENGQQLKATSAVPLSKAGIHTGIVFVVDTSRSMGINGGLDQTKTSIRKVINAMGTGDAAGIVAFGTTATVIAPLSTNHAATLASLDTMSAPGSAKTALWDGIKRGAALFEDAPKIQPNLVVITDGFDDSSTATKSQGRTEVTRSGAAVFALAYNQQNQVDGKSLTGLVDLAGGRMFTAPRSTDLANALDTVQTSLANQYVVTYASEATQGATDLEVNVAGVTDTKTFVPGSVAQGNSALSPPVVPKSILPSFVTSGVGKILAMGAIFLAVMLGVYAVALLVGKDDSTLENVLMPYTDGYNGEEQESDGALAQTALLQRAVEMTEGFAERQGFLTKVEKKLEQANLPLRAAEAIFFWIATVVLLGFLAIVVEGPFMGLILLGLLAALPLGILNYLAKRRQKIFNTQLPDMLQLLSGSLRAGYSLMQGVEAVAQEVGEPMGKELRRVCTEARLGRELEESMDGIAERMDSADFEWAVMAIRIQREVGGNLAELLNTVGETMIERERLRREVNSLTAEGKISAIMLGLLPPVIGMVMWVVNPEYMGVLFKDSLGKGLLIGAIVMALIGFAWMKKTITIEI